MIVGLDAPTAGVARVNGRTYREHRAPLREVGVLLEARAIHPGRSARDHLRALAATHAIADSRVEQTLDLVGLHEVAGKRAGAFSLGMGQRLGIAAALLGDPGTVILDEPVNGLDPEGVLWVRTLLRGLAAEGRTVFLSSHLMSEMALTADHLIVVGRGRLIADLPVEELTRRAASDRVLVRSPDATTLRERLAGPGVVVASGSRGELEVSGLTSAEIGVVASDHGLTLHELTPQRATLEEAFMELTRDAVEFEAVAA